MRKKGQAVMEIALVLPILLLMLCAIADFGRILYSSAHLNLVAQEAVRLAALGQADSNIIEYVEENTYLVNSKAVSVTMDPSEYLRKSGDYVTLTINYKVNYITPLLNKILPSTYDVKIQSTMRIE
jgi:Flp pilus assembly protein TadG